MNIDYRIDARQAAAHRFHVTLTVQQAPAELDLSLPVWIPGSYLVREFARHLLNLQATQSGRERPMLQTGKASWRVRTSGKAPLVIEYDVYANDTSVRAAFLDTRRGFFNGTSVFLKVDGAEAPSALQVRIEGLPKGWEVATSLKAVKVDERGVGQYEAPDYDDLVDHPVELGSFWRGRFKVRGVPHEFVVAGAAEGTDFDRLLKDTEKICESQIAFWHGRRKPAFDRYTFLLNVVEDGYGGLEHRNSTALICARKDLPRQGRTPVPAGYDTLLGLISHEYFHTWNVKRLKPVEFDPCDYTRENHTTLLWFFEGFTSYYDDQFLLRSGRIDAATYLKLLTKPVNQVLATPGRRAQSLAQASFDAWTRYYRPDENTANATVSYYTKGSLVALALDLSLRLCAPAPDGRQPSLDGVMQRLWALGRSIGHDDVVQALTQEATEAPRHAVGWGELLDAWVNGTGDLPLEELLRAFGVQWESRLGPLQQRWGLRLQAAPGGLKVQAVMHGGTASDIGLSAGDELIALNDWRLRTVDDLSQWHQQGVANALLLCRDQRLMTLKVPPEEGALRDARVVALALDEGAVGERSRRRQAWLGH